MIWLLQPALRKCEGAGIGTLQRSALFRRATVGSPTCNAQRQRCIRIAGGLQQGAPGCQASPRDQQAQQRLMYMFSHPPTIGFTQ
ncbi:hypothetical protein D3C75_1069390 [compost metagenome]